MKGPLETLWYWPSRLGRKEQWKLWPSEYNCLALSLPNTLRAYKHHRQRGKGLISNNIKFSELCDLWENMVIWENHFLKLKSRLGGWGRLPRLSLPLKMIADQSFLLERKGHGLPKYAATSLSRRPDAQLGIDTYLHTFHKWMDVKSKKTGAFLVPKVRERCLPRTFYPNCCFSYGLDLYGVP